jgi:hypothetical protein
MYYLIYISTAVRPMGQQDLINILTESREKNIKLSITGLLLYAQGSFIQQLEGSEENVMLTYQEILRDYRHKNVIKLISGPNEGRMFPKWSMGFASIAREELKELEGYIDPDTEMFDPGASHRAIKIMKSFADSNKTLTYNWM